MLSMCVSFTYVFAQCGMCVCASVCIAYMSSYECTCMCGGVVCGGCSGVYASVCVCVCVCVCVPIHMCMCVFFYVHTLYVHTGLCELLCV